MSDRDSGQVAIRVWPGYGSGGSSRVVQTFTILTTTPNELCGAIPKHRPVILARPEWRAWLGERDTDQLLAILRPFPTDSMDAYPVDRCGGNFRNSDAGLLDEIAVAA
jgi:putative SOS response-associated peptidase YedK